jgi:octaprenyl-diphosphate synthase
MKTADLSALQRFAGNEAAALETAMRNDLADGLKGCDPFLVEVLEHGLFGGGKRIRPLLFILSARLCGVPGPDLYTLASAFEYLHVATLIHDDVIDNAKERRGRDSVAHKYGTSAAILAGDWLHARSMYLVGHLAGPEGLEVFCRSTAGMVDGEFLQLRHVADCGISEQQYFAIIHRKTGLLISSTCEIGAVFAGGTTVQREALSRYGAKLGAAFQVVDDLLDYQGESGTTGKRTGNDFVEGKLTLPLIHALAAAAPAEKGKIIALVAGDRQREDSLKYVTHFIEVNAGFASARQTAEKLTGQAIDALDVFSENNDSVSLEMLHGLAGYVLARNK